MAMGSEARAWPANLTESRSEGVEMVVRVVISRGERPRHTLCSTLPGDPSEKGPPWLPYRPRRS